MIPFLDLNRQFQAIEPEVRAAIDRVLARGWFVLGEELEHFESAFATHLGAHHAIGVGSGTDATHLALRALNVGPGDEVITAANTCVPTAAGICASGADLVLADVDPQTLTLDPQSVERAITPKTKAIVPVHLYGHPCAMDELRARANHHGLVIVEDCAQAHGAAFRGQSCGTLGDAAAFSFYPSKNLGCYGDGGAVVTNHAECAERVRALRNYGERERYHHHVQGFNSRLDELQAAVLNAKLPFLESWTAARRECAAWYQRTLANLPITLSAEAAWAKHVYHLFVVRTPERDALRTHLTDHGIGTQLHYPVPIHLQEAFRHLGKAPGSYPEAERACAEVLSLPLYPELTDDERARIAGAMRAFFA